MAGPARTLTKNTVAALAEAQAPMQLTGLYSSTPQPLSSTPTWCKVTENLGYGSFFASASSLSVPIFFLPGGGIIHGIKIVPRVAFGGPGITGYTVSVGTLAAPTQLSGPFDVTQPPSSTNFQLSSNFIEYDEVAVTPIYAQAVSTGANLVLATCGQVDIYAYLSVGL